MYCINCGKEIPDDAQFCLQCGKAINSSVDSEKPVMYKNPEVSSELNREAVKIYLRNLLHAEIALWELKEKREVVSNRMKKLSKYIGYKSFKIYEDSAYRIHLRWKDNKIYILTYDPQGFGRSFVFLEPLESSDKDAWKCNLYRDCLVWEEVEPIRKKLLGVSLFGSSVWNRNYTLIDRVGIENIYKVSHGSYKKKDAIDRFIASYNEMLYRGQQIYLDSYKIYQSVEQAVAFIDEKIKEGEELKERLYNLNIIPKIYRNIHSIYFINDYIQTSRENINSAFLRLDLDIIVKRHVVGGGNRRLFSVYLPLLIVRYQCRRQFKVGTTADCRGFV